MKSEAEKKALPPEKKEEEAKKIPAQEKPLPSPESPSKIGNKPLRMCSFLIDEADEKSGNESTGVKKVVMHFQEKAPAPKETQDNSPEEQLTPEELAHLEEVFMFLYYNCNFFKKGEEKKGNEEP